MKQIKSLNSFFALNILKLTSFHSFKRVKRTREKNQHFFHIPSSQIPATTHILGQNYEIPWLFPDFLGIWNFPDQFAKFPDFSLTLKKNQTSLIFPWPVAILPRRNPWPKYECSLMSCCRDIPIRETFNVKKWKLAFISVLLQIFWQKFYRNVPGEVLYKGYEFCPNCWFWLVAMATEMLNFRKKYSKIFFSEVIRGVKLKLCINVCVIMRYINFVFIAVAHVVLLLWQL